MSCLTAPPLVSLLSLSRVQSQINSSLSLTLTCPPTRIQLQLPRRCAFPPSPPPRRKGAGSLGASPGIAPLCTAVGAGHEPEPGKGRPLCPSTAACPKQESLLLTLKKNFF